MIYRSNHRPGITVHTTIPSRIQTEWTHVFQKTSSLRQGLATVQVGTHEVDANVDSRVTKTYLFLLAIPESEALYKA